MCGIADRQRSTFAKQPHKFITTPVWRRPTPSCQVTCERITRSATAAVGKPILSLSILKNPTCCLGLFFFLSLQGKATRLSLGAAPRDLPGPAASSGPAGIPKHPHRNSHLVPGTEVTAQIYPGPFNLPRVRTDARVGNFRGAEIHLREREKTRQAGPLGATGGSDRP